MILNCSQVFKICGMHWKKKRLPLNCAVSAAVTDGHGFQKEDSKKPDIQLEGREIWWNRQTDGWLQNPEAKLEMGSIYSLAGLDINYAAVIIGPDLIYDIKDQKIKVNRQNYFDNKVKQGVTDES